MTRSILLAALFLGFVLSAESAWAQRRYQSRYGPTITPYLDYLNVNPGATNNYYQYIQPRRELRQQFRQLGTTVRQQGSALQSVSGQLQLIQQPNVAPTGGASTFLNYSHYYGGLPR